MTDAAPPSFVTPVDLPFPPAERVGAKVEYYHYLPHEPLYLVDVYFVGRPPERATIDRVLRECITLAAAHESRYDIHADAYLLASADTDLDERQDLNPYGEDRFLCFDARLGRTEVRRVEDGDEEDEDLDEATEDMRASVEEWLWYGYHSAEVIDGWIEERAAEGDGFDLEWIKAFAAEALAEKRAAEAGWPEETDNDRLDRAFAQLDAQGICALQWAGDTMSDGIEAVSERLNSDEVPPGRYQGFCFFHSQDMDRALDGEGLLLAFGPTDSETDAGAARIGRLVCAALQQHGLKTQWDGTANRRIELPGLRWQRRTPG